MTVEKIYEKTVFVASDGTAHDTMDEACDYQEALDFRNWCAENICGGGEWTADMVANAILESFKIAPKE